MSMDISEITRRDIVDVLNIGIESPSDPLFSFHLYWSGRMNEENFLLRLYDLHSMPSNDHRFKDAFEDIRQHRTNNEDWDNDWVFYDSRFDLLHAPDEQLLNFLCEMFHPAVRLERQNWEIFLSYINGLLEPDGFSIVEKSKMSGRAIYGWERIDSQNLIAKTQFKDIEQKFDSAYISSQLTIMNDAIETAPNVAIGKAKELLETCCKTILNERQIPYSTELDLTQLMKKACESIGLDAKKTGRSGSGIIAAKILGNLCAISQGMAELRNLYGDGHGKDRNFRTLPPRYANLAVGVSAAAVEFMWDTYIEKYRKQTT